MKRFLFAALAFMSLSFAACSDDNGGPAEGGGDYNFVNSHLSFEYNMSGDVAALVDVVPSTTLPASQGSASVSSSGNKHTIFISNIKCPAEFDVVYTLKPKDGITIEENKNYEYSADYNYVITRNFDDNSHIEGDSGGEKLTGVIPGKQAEDFFKMYGVQKFSFKLSVDGYLEEINEE